MNGRLGLGDENDRHEGVLLTTWLSASNAPGVGIAGNNGCMTPPTITTICAGSTHNLAMSATGDVFSWGNGVDGQLGHGSTVSEWVPRQLAFFKDLSIVSISCGTSHSMAVARTGIVYTWGSGAEGQLGLDLVGDPSVNTVDQNVQVPHPVAIHKGATQRVAIRSIVAKNNVSLALDDRDRLFVWGDNALEQLGFPLNANTDQGTKSFLSRPRMRAYMDLHAPKSTTPSSQTTSRAANLRELVAAAKPEPIRLGLAHVEAGDRFTMLLFSTKPGISSSTAPSESRELVSRVSSEISPEPKDTTISKWNFSLTEDLPISAIPSRESVFYRFMANYRVYMRPTISRTCGDESDEEMERRSPRRRDRKGSTISKKNNVLPTDPTVPDKSTNEGNSSSPAHVQGFDSWLNKRRNSPSKTNLTGTSFINTHRVPSPAKQQEIRIVSSLEATQTTVKPQRPKSGCGQNRSNRKLTAFISEPPNTSASLSSNQKKVSMC
ncbi:RCC1 and BTB domain-containing protein 2 [Phytophthora citrophthora]|uniref:RCC1 and BTB domain-containing protein 2 n=1 Tax=Phytophthora citrophthora TaxID=4793 RepID=A0AAD9GX26_9STRA|nr:RCC1 and BTB domain-containing protein 2 [Phytophthora citrophthora]